jgi:hypothetical protein
VIPVIIPALKGERQEGTAYPDPPDPISMEYGLEPPDIHRNDFAVRVVPPGALQALLRRSRSFAAFQNRFGALSERDRNVIRGLFKLIEAVRSKDEKRLGEYLAFVLAKRKSESKTRPVNTIRYLFEHDRKQLKKHGPLRTLVNELQSAGTLRLWWNDAERTLAFAILAEDFTQALRVHLLLLLQAPESTALCKRCGRQFTRTKSTQVFCSAKCGNNDRKARQRGKEKENSSYVTRKTR